MTIPTDTELAQAYDQGYADGLKAMTTQKQVRAAFWQGFPVLKESGQYTIRKRQNDYSATVRCEWVDFVDMLARDGHISKALASRVTL